MSTEFAGIATPQSTAMLSIPQSFEWLADTGATSHMTPHRHWMRNYSPLRVPIRLADNTIIYSAGVGSIQFQPTVRGEEADLLEFGKVLHVPALQNNLLSCLFLTKHKGFEILINATHMDFKRKGKTLFCAPISDNSSASLEGHTIPNQETANWASTLPMTTLLWHRRCCHHSMAQDADPGTGDWDGYQLE